MPSNEINNELEFEQHISKLTDRGLIEFVARQQSDMSKVCPAHDKTIKKVEGRANKAMGASGGVGALLGGVIMWLIELFIRRG